MIPQDQKNIWEIEQLLLDIDLFELFVTETNGYHIVNRYEEYNA